MVLTRGDIKRISDLIDFKITTRLDDFEERIEERIRNLPTREEYFQRADKIIGMLQKMEQELIFSNHRLNNHEDRITVLENVALV